MWGVFLYASILAFPTPIWKEIGNTHVTLSKEDPEGSILLLFLIKKSLE